MDKVPSSDLDRRFSDIQHEVLTSNQRYLEVRSRFSEQGMAQGESLLIRSPGLTVTYLKLQSDEPVAIQSAESGEEVGSVFVLNGKVTSRFERLSTPIIAESRQHVFLYSPGSASQHLIEPGPFETLHVDYDLHFIKSLLETAGNRHMDRLHTSLERKEVFQVAPDRFHLQAQMLDVFRALKQESLQGPTRLLLLESRLLELLSGQIEQVTRATTPAGSGLTPADRKKLQDVHRYIEQHYLLPLSLGQLCQLVGLNEFKLKKGYKLLFQTTVFGHILQLRLTRARQLLTEGQLTVTETAEVVGYSNVQAFSAAFRKMFGYPPSKLATRPFPTSVY